MASSTSKRVLFVCSHNSNRSIAAEAVARKERPDLIVASAGIDEPGILNPKMVEALNLRGYSTDGLRSKKLSDAEIGGLTNNWDFIFTMGCAGGLPTTPPATTVVEDWGLPNPGSDPKLLNEIIDTVIEKVRLIGVTPKRVLFVCNHNASRSIAAEAVARASRPDLVVASAAVSGEGVINPKMAEALAARGFSTDGLRSKNPSDPEVGGLDNNWDYIITPYTVSPQTKLPFEPPPGAIVEHWELPDPASDPKAVDAVINKIVEKTKTLAATSPSGATTASVPKA